MPLFDSSKYEVIVIGGSAGSIPVVTQISKMLPADFPLPILMILHRLKNRKGGLLEVLVPKAKIKIIEPDDKAPIEPGTIHVASADYHLLVETDKTISLSNDILVQYSRPSIDVTMESVADIYKEKVIGILLSGANKDGALGMKKIKEKGGYTIIQDPDDCVIATMPLSAKKVTEIDKVLKIDEIVQFLKDNFT